jgi:hypothetical protein
VHKLWQKHFKPDRDKYDRVKLVRLTYDHSTNEKPKDRLLAAFFAFAGLSITADEDIDFEDPTRRDELRASLDNFADYLFDDFFLPLKAPTKKNTPAFTDISFSRFEYATPRTYLRRDSRANRQSKRSLSNTRSLSVCYIT